MPLFTGTIGGEPEAPRELPLMSLREVVMFPRAIVPLFVGRDASIKAIESAVARYDKHILLVTQKEADMEKPGPGDLYPVGVVSKILQLLRLRTAASRCCSRGCTARRGTPFRKRSLSETGRFPVCA